MCPRERENRRQGEILDFAMGHSAGTQKRTGRLAGEKSGGWCTAIGTTKKGRRGARGGMEGGGKTAKGTALVKGGEQNGGSRRKMRR